MIVFLLSFTTIRTARIPPISSVCVCVCVSIFSNKCMLLIQKYLVQLWTWTWAIRLFIVVAVTRSITIYHKIIKIQYELIEVWKSARDIFVSITIEWNWSEFFRIKSKNLVDLIEKQLLSETQHQIVMSGKCWQE